MAQIHEITAAAARAHPDDWDAYEQYCAEHGIVARDHYREIGGAVWAIRIVGPINEFEARRLDSPTPTITARGSVFDTVEGGIIVPNIDAIADYVAQRLSK